MPRLWPEAVEVERQPVVHRALPVQPGERLPLGIRDRHHGRLGELLIDRDEVWKIKPAVQRGHMRGGLSPRQREVPVIDVEVDEVEVLRLLKNLLQEEKVMGELVRTPVIEAQPLRARGHETSAGDGIAAGEERHLMALADQSLSQVRDDTLDTSCGRQVLSF